MRSKFWFKILSRIQVILVSPKTYKVALPCNVAQLIGTGPPIVS